MWMDDCEHVHTGRVHEIKYPQLCVCAGFYPAFGSADVSCTPDGSASLGSNLYSVRVTT